MSFACVELFFGWQFHEKQFPNVNFLAKEILEIIRSQIKIERVRSFVGLSIAFGVVAYKWTI